MHLLTINAGSASLRLAAFRATPDGLERVAADHSDAPLDDPVAAIEAFVTRHELPRPAAVAHRLVHGGGRWTEPCLIDAQDEADLRQLVPLAPLHMPPALAAMAASRKLFGTRTAQVAVFDTAFFQELPEVAAVYALPAELSSRLQLRRYGFHGIAHAALWRRWREIGRGDRLVSLQLGSGSSITATRNGKPLDTSMGFTPLEGLVMATRCGDLDPGLLLHLQANGLDSEALTDTLYRRSGLLGLSGISGDMRELLGADDAAARLAIALYCYRARKYLGAYLTVLGGADGILFGGGIGEHSPEIRARILTGLEWLGIALDAELNSALHDGEGRISHADSRIAVWVVPVDEESLLAEAAHELAKANPSMNEHRRIS
jgi:acetate kinase